MRQEIEAARVERAIRALLGVSVVGIVVLVGMIAYAIASWIG